MVTYSTNWMGPVSTAWYKERGLTNGSEIITYYSCGRIDIRDDRKLGYDGWDEYSLAPMHGEDWNALSDWLDSVTTVNQWEYEALIAEFEHTVLGREIRWWKE